TQPSATATIAVKPSIPIEPTLTAATTPSSGVVTISSTSAQPPSTDDDMYDRTPDKRKDRHGFQWIFSAGVLTVRTVSLIRGEA
uniref:Uncharacterized protein n=1 Tax=Romanomermis culicivorax TaxID=13658 RepID=A0A915J1Y6_ROMCU